MEMASRRRFGALVYTVVTRVAIRIATRAASGGMSASTTMACRLRLLAGLSHLAEKTDSERVAPLPRRIASQQCTQMPHSATGDSRKDALWGCRPHGKAHFACGPHQTAHSATGRLRRVRFSVRDRAQNALFRRVRFSSPAQTWSHLTQRRILRRRSHVKAQSAPGTSQKTALCAGDATAT